MITCRLLGPIEVLIDGAPPPPELLWRKHLALLVYLACSPRRTRARDHLVGLLWPDRPEPAARHSLNEALRVLRRVLGAGLEVTPGQIRLATDAVRLDIEEFQLLASTGQWQGAAALVHGELLEGFGIPGASAFEDWLAATRAQWRQRAGTALTQAASACTAAGALPQAQDAARRALALDGTSDPAVRELMRAATFSGNRGEALAAYTAFTARLKDELAAEPEPETAALAERIRRERLGGRPSSTPAGSADRRPPLVGRAEELGSLLELWSRCRTHSRMQLGVIAGERGTGKSRLLEEIVVRARLDGGGVAHVRAVQADVDVPFGTLLALARGGLGEAAGLAAAPAAALAAFAALLPEWGQRFPAVRTTASTLLPTAFVEVVRAIAQEQPLLLAVDDAHWADRESLLALELLAREREQGPLVLLLTVMPTDERPELDELRQRLGIERSAAAIHLDSLKTAELAELVRWACPAFAPDEVDRLARRIALDSAGLPVFAVELVHAIAAGLALAPGSAAWPAPDRTLDHTLPADLPDSLVAAIRISFRRLSADAQTALAAAAVLGDRITAAALTSTTSLPPAAVIRALDELEWQRWLQADPRGYTFVARIAQDVIARDMLTPGQRQRIRAAAGMS